MFRSVLMTTDAVGGVWTYALDLSRALARSGIHVTLATMGPRPSPSRYEDAKEIDIRWRDYKLEWMDDPWDDVDEASEWLLSLEREVAPEVVHLNGYSHGAIAWKAPKLVVAHSCVLSWWSAVHSESAPAAWDEYRRRVKMGIHAADYVVAPSNAMLQAIKTLYGYSSPAAVIPNGCDTALFRSVPKEPIILTAGRFWDRAKNLQALDYAAQRCEWPVYAAGEGGDFHNIKRLGTLAPTSLRDWYARASIYALPARYEPFGLSILEAALSGCALVLGDIPSLRENWSGAAAFVDPDDEGELLHQLQSLIRSPEKRAKLGQTSKARAQRFTLERMAGDYLACYAALRCRNHPATALRS